jgi:hypothetical protein
LITKTEDLQHLLFINHRHACKVLDEDTSNLILFDLQSLLSIEKVSHLLLVDFNHRAIYLVLYVHLTLGDLVKEESSGSGNKPLLEL